MVTTAEAESLCVDVSSYAYHDDDRRWKHTVMWDISLWETIVMMLLERRG
jgi:hypothetical protein